MRGTSLQPGRGPGGRGYGLDGNIRILRIDNNRNGIIETATGRQARPGVHLLRAAPRRFQVLRTGHQQQDGAEADVGARLYGRRRRPVLVEPTPAKVRIGNAIKTVLFFGGGYDDEQDIQPYQADDSGHGVYMVDAMNGDLLWHSGPPGSGADLQLAGMVNAQPGTCA